MPQVLEQNQAQVLPRSAEVYYHSSPDDAEIIYPEQREDDMGETSIHISLVANFLNILKLFFKSREDIFLSGNMNLYYEKGNPNKWFAPDLLVAFGVPNHDRKTYRLWEEKIFPQVIFEVSSNRTWKNDISDKLEIYSELGAEEYYVLDPEFAYLPAPMMVFHRKGERLLSVPVENERVFSPRLGLEIVRAENTFRLFNPEKREFLRTLEEAESEVERLKAEIEKLKAEK